MLTTWVCWWEEQNKFEKKSNEWRAFKKKEKDIQERQTFDMWMNGNGRIGKADATLTDQQKSGSHVWEPEHTSVITA